MTRPALNRDDAALLRELERLAEDAATKIDAARVHDATIVALHAVWPALLIAPLIQAVVAIGFVSVGLAPPILPVFVLLFFTVAPPVLGVLVARRQARDRESSRTDALALVDARIESEDRLVTAFEFLRRRAEGPYERAAIADARAHVARADRLAVAPRRREFELDARGAIVVGLSFVLIVLSAFLNSDGEGGTVTATPRPVAVSAEVDAVAEEERLEEEGRRATPREREVRDTRTPRRSGREVAAAGREQRADLTDDIKKTEGLTGDGRSADAASASGASSSRGVPTNQAQASKSAGKKSKKKSRKDAKPPKAGEKAPEKKPEDDAGATAGRGAASGSNKSPSTSSWSSKDQVTSEDEDDLEDDEEIDDEFDDSETRGGLQPQLRDRKPAVNRDLAIGFGNQKNPDANGRGGPSEQKKSRGVASLVLGVPIPDHVKGRPNPGKTKITQERVEPREENAAPVAAADRLERDRPAGGLDRLTMTSWMRDLVRNFYLDIRSDNEGE